MFNLVSCDLKPSIIELVIGVLLDKLNLRWWMSNSLVDKHVEILVEELLAFVLFFFAFDFCKLGQFVRFYWVFEFVNCLFVENAKRLVNTVRFSFMLVRVFP